VCTACVHHDDDDAEVQPQQSEIVSLSHSFMNVNRQARGRGFDMIWQQAGSKRQLENTFLDSAKIHNVKKNRKLGKVI
jgi:hypothetical protein